MTTYYISSGHKDGLGGNLRHLIKANIFANNNYYEFINFCNPKILNSKPFYKTFSFFNNSKKIGDIPDGSNVIIYGDYHKDELVAEIKKEYSYKKFNYVDLRSNDLYLSISKFNYNQELREKHQIMFHNRSDNKNYNLCFPNHINIVLHIRRGDVFRKLLDGSRPDYNKRFTTDDVFFWAIKKVISIIPKNYKIIIFSEGKENEFAEYKKRWPDVMLNIDKEEWRYIIDEEKLNHKDYNRAVENMKKLICTCGNADIFIGSKSHLSHILAYVNKNVSFFENFFNENFTTLKDIYKFENITDVLEKRYKSR